MSKILLALLFSLITTLSFATTHPFDLTIQGDEFNIKKSLELSDVDEGKTKINFTFKNNQNKHFTFDLNYKKLASNRSYPSNLDITIKDDQGKKLGYLFFANNSVDALKKIGIFGLIIDINGKPVDIKFSFDSTKKGSLYVADLGHERFVQDTLVPKFNFQMIRPVILPSVQAGIRSITYSLDHHPYDINYTLLDKENGTVEFQHNLYSKQKQTSHLLERIYFRAHNLETLREAMFAGKYFHTTDGTFKLVFYPAMGQTEPPKH
ncbi:MAG: hypothetical protein KAI02_04435 [Gammaproteobacteria bacterium]|nr:hypothetical protein [Gammaproteobacteria bacterium]